MRQLGSNAPTCPAPVGRPALAGVSRALSLGQSTFAATGEQVLLTRTEMDAQLATAMAGVAAEELYFGESSTTAEDDIDRAIELALQMVGRYGMSVEIGWRRILSKG